MKRKAIIMILLFVIGLGCSPSKNMVKILPVGNSVYEADPRKNAFKSKEEINAWAKQNYSSGGSGIDSFSFSINSEYLLKNIFIICPSYGSAIINKKVYVFEDNIESWELKLETEVLTRKVLSEKVENKIILRTLKNIVFLEIPFYLFFGKIER